MKKKLFLVATITTVLASCGGGGGMPNFGDNEYPVQEVTTSAAAMQTTYPAVINGIQDVEIRPKVTGFLTQINVTEGQTVQAGQVLFVIDNATYQAAVRQSQAAVNTAKTPIRMNGIRESSVSMKRLDELASTMLSSDPSSASITYAISSSVDGIVELKRTFLSSSFLYTPRTVVTLPPTMTSLSLIFFSLSVVFSS